MNRSQFIAMAQDVKGHPERLAEYRKVFRNVDPFSDGVFKLLMANEAKPERTIKFLNAMLGLEGEKAVSKFALGVQENPGILNDKTAVLVFFREVLAQLKLRNFIEKDILRLSSGEATFLR